jgi:hypothetical protein
MSLTEQAQEWIEKFHDTAYLKYLNMFREFVTHQKKTSLITDKYFVVKDNETGKMTKVMFPVYVNTSKEIETLKEDIHSMHIDYICGERTSEITDALTEQYAYLDQLQFYDHLINTDPYKSIVKKMIHGELTGHIKGVHLDEDKSLNEIYASLKAIKELKRVQGDGKVSFAKIYAHLKSMHEILVDLRKPKGRINVYIAELPTFQEVKSKRTTAKLDANDAKDAKQNADNKPKKQSMKKVAAKKTTTKSSKKQVKQAKEVLIEDVIKQFPLGELPFKTKDQCESRDTKQKYYISKADLVKLIQSKAEMKEWMPPGFAKLKKGDICQEIFRS